MGWIWGDSPLHDLQKVGVALCVQQWRGGHKWTKLQQKCVYCTVVHQVDLLSGFAEVGIGEQNCNIERMQNHGLGRLNTLAEVGSVRYSSMVLLYGVKTRAEPLTHLRNAEQFICVQMKRRGLHVNINSTVHPMCANSLVFLNTK